MFSLTNNHCGFYYYMYIHFKAEDGDKYTYGIISLNSI